jgi:hypothetical protein
MSRRSAPKALGHELRSSPSVIHLGEMLEQVAMNEDVSTSDLLQDLQIVSRVIKKSDDSQWQSRRRI